jgi:hypothetical protein
LYIGPSDYDNFLLDNTVSKVILHDHLGGFDQNLKSPVLDRLASQSDGRTLIVESEYIFDQRVKKNYPNFDFVFSLPLHNQLLDNLKGYTIHPELTFKNFLCSFNGTSHVGRKLLVSGLEKFGLFNPTYSSKNFVFTKDIISGHIKDYLEGIDQTLYDKFFIPDNEIFCDTIYSFGHERFNHKKNIYTLEKQLTESFVHVVSDTMSTSYYPFYGEKFLYSVVTRGLFVAYAHPNWHQHLEMYYGFKKYNNIFNYNFDSISNPVKRLLELITMILKFNKLSSDDWRDLYLLELDTIEYNYDHYFSNGYLKHLEKCT